MRGRRTLQVRAVNVFEEWGFRNETKFLRYVVPRLPLATLLPTVVGFFELIDISLM